MGLDNLFALWDEFVEILVNNGEQILHNPIVWVGIVVLIIGLFALYDVPEKTEQNSLSNIVRQLIQMILDTSGDIINAIKSITGFISVIKLLLFGKIDSRTQFVLNNYAIIFLSMASFYTTFRGLNQIMGFVVAALVSFGIQVSILVVVTYIILATQKESPKTDWKYLYLFNMQGDNADNDSDIISHIRHLYIRSPHKDGEQAIKVSEEANADEKKEFVKKDGYKRDRKALKVILASFLVVMSVGFSSSFSYLFIFERLVMPGITLDDYTRSIDTVNRVAEEYSAEMREYQSGLTRILQTYNDKIPKLLEFDTENPAVVQRMLEGYKEQSETLQTEIDALVEEIDDLENGDWRVMSS